MSSSALRCFCSHFDLPCILPQAVCRYKRAGTSLGRHKTNVAAVAVKNAARMVLCVPSASTQAGKAYKMIPLWPEGAESRSRE